MSNIHYGCLQIGDQIPVLINPPISRTTLALFAGASGDHNPIHIDIDFAKKSGIDDVFAQGMLVMAYLGRMLTSWVPQATIRQYSVRFISITHLNDEITCKGKIIEKFEKAGEKFLKLDVTAENQDGDVKLSGEAVIALQ